jgi:rhodanese-related sulfurtransferase
MKRIRTIGFVTLTSLACFGCQSAPTKKVDSPAVVTTAGVSEISPAAARPAVEAAYSQFIDVRTPEEYAAGHAYRTRIPVDNGFPQAISISGGTEAWQAAGLPMGN